MASTVEELLAASVSPSSDDYGSWPSAAESLLDDASSSLTLNVDSVFPDLRIHNVQIQRDGTKFRLQT